MPCPDLSRLCVGVPWPALQAVACPQAPHRCALPCPSSRVLLLVLDLMPCPAHRSCTLPSGFVPWLATICYGLSRDRKCKYKYLQALCPALPGLDRWMRNGFGTRGRGGGGGKRLEGPSIGQWWPLQSTPTKIKLIGFGPLFFFFFIFYKKENNVYFSPRGTRMLKGPFQSCTWPF